MKYILLLLPVALAACSPTPSGSVANDTTRPASSVMQPVSSQPTKAHVLGQYHWQLSEATGHDGRRIDALFVRPEQPLQLDFAADRLNVSHTCNRMTGSYQLEHDQLQFGPFAQTMMACSDPALMALDTAVGEHLRGKAKLTAQTDGNVPQLHLLTADGVTLIFIGQPTAETRYGSAGETVFMEVAAQTGPCGQPLSPDQRCLQVRERSYDVNGLRTGTPGEWQPLHQDIEGYTHEAGVRNVLRLKRYTIKNPSADTPATAYVLDMVVESEVVKPATP